MQACTCSLEVGGHPTARGRRRGGQAAEDPDRRKNEFKQLAEAKSMYGAVAEERAKRLVLMRCPFAHTRLGSHTSKPIRQGLEDSDLRRRPLPRSWRRYRGVDPASW